MVYYLLVFERKFYEQFCWGCKHNLKVNTTTNKQLFSNSYDLSLQLFYLVSNIKMLQQIVTSAISDINPVARDTFQTNIILFKFISSNNNPVCH